MLAQECPCQHEEQPLQHHKQEHLLGGQFWRGCQAPPALQGRMACLPGKDTPCGARATTDALGPVHSHEPHTQVDMIPCLDLVLQREVSSSVLDVVLIYTPNILLLMFLFFIATPSHTPP